MLRYLHTVSVCLVQPLVLASCLCTEVPTRYCIIIRRTAYSMYVPWCSAGQATGAVLALSPDPTEQIWSLRDGTDGFAEFGMRCEFCAWG